MTVPMPNPSAMPAAEMSPSISSMPPSVRQQQPSIERPE